jgi:hypothetical protein
MKVLTAVCAIFAKEGNCNLKKKWIGLVITKFSKKYMKIKKKICVCVCV